MTNSNGNGNGMGARLGKFVIKFRWVIMAFIAGGAFMAASGMQHLQFSTNYRYFFSEENPQLKAFDELQKVYTKNDTILFVIEPKDGKVFTKDTLSVIEKLTKDSWQIPYSLRVDSVTNFQYTSSVGDDLIVRDLIEGAETFTPDELEEAKKIALNEPQLKNRLVSSKAHVTGVNVTLNYPEKKMSEVPEAVGFARAMADEIRAANPNINVYMSGITMMNNSFMEVSQHDMATLTPLMYLVIIIVAFLLFGKIFPNKTELKIAFIIFGFLLIGAFRAGITFDQINLLLIIGGLFLCILVSRMTVLGTVLVTAFSFTTGMGMAGWLDIWLTPPSAIAPNIIITLAIADSVHFLITMLHEMRHGKNKNDAIIESLRVNLQPIFLTSITTAIGFLSMNFSDAPPFHDLGNIVAMGVIAAFLYSVVFLPAFMSIVPVRVRPSMEGEKYIMEHLAEFVIAKSRRLFVTMFVIIVVLFVGLFQIQFNDQFVKYFDERFAFRTDSDFTTKNMTGIYQVEYSLGSETTVSDPEFLKKVEEFANWYRTIPEVRHVNTITDIMKRLNKNMHGDDPAYYRLPDDNELSAQYLLLYEMSLPYGLDINNMINVDKTATKLTVNMIDVETVRMLEIEAKASQWLRDNAPASMQVAGSSPTIMFSHITKRNINSMVWGTTFALVVISGILIFALKSFKIGFLSLVPNLTPAIMAFGLWGFLMTKVGMGLAIVTAMTLGIVVDDTVHFLSKYLRARREQGLDAPDAVRYAFKTVGTALWVTSFILIAGFLVMTQSGFKMNSDMGTLTAVAIAFALIADFLFLPPLLMKLDKGTYNSNKGEN